MPSAPRRIAVLALAASAALAVTAAPAATASAATTSATTAAEPGVCLHPLADVKVKVGLKDRLKAEGITTASGLLKAYLKDPLHISATAAGVSLHYPAGGDHSFGSGPRCGTADLGGLSSVELVPAR